MSEDKRPLKQCKTRGRPLLQEVQTVNDADDVFSTTSSSSSENLPPVRPEIHALGNFAWLDPCETASEDEDEDDETSTSSDSEGLDEVKPSEEGSSEDEDEQEESFSKVPRTSAFTTIAPRESDLSSRLQSFLPEFQQANTELGLGGDVQKQRIDNVSDADEQYIEMNPSLGVLAEQSNEDGHVRMPRPQGEDDQTPNDEDVLINLPIAGNAQKSMKRKVEELE